MQDLVIGLKGHHAGAMMDKKDPTISAEEFRSAIDKMPEAELVAFVDALSAEVPWQYSETTGTYRDPDGAPIGMGIADKEESQFTRQYLQNLCWIRAHRNPQVATSIADRTGRMTGMGFEVSSDERIIQEFISEVTNDPRNRLYHLWRAYVARSKIEGELFLCLSCHDDGFIEVDFIDPASISGDSIIQNQDSMYHSTGDDTGILWHPDKACFPLAYNVKSDSGGKTVQIPSINIAYFPEDLIRVLQNHDGYHPDRIQSSRSRRFKNIGGFDRFIVSWDLGYVTKRSVGYVRTVLEWINHYENIKKFELDHKKSAGAFAWEYSFDDWKNYLKWLSLTDEEKKKTPMGAKITPGSRVITPPGVTLLAKNPNLPRISDSDTDILHQITSGLNEAEDVSTGQSKGTFASVKASRGPMSDRISDDLSYFQRFLILDFWRPVLFLKSQITPSFPYEYERDEAVDFKDGEPVMGKVKRKAWELVEVNFPTTEVSDPEGRSKAFYGVKHGSLYDTAGVPNSTLLSRMGFGNYRKLRLDHATEQKRYPKLVPTVDAESFQEKTRGESRTGEKPEEDNEE